MPARPPLILTVVGARPQFVKAAVVAQALADRGDVRETIVHTGQHWDPAMSAVFFEELGLPRPSRDLGLGGGTHGAMTGRMLEALETCMLEERPRAVVVYGDTNSTIAGALAAAKLGIPVAHVEAGLRSGDRRQPEEINRVVTDHLAALLLAPTDTAVEHLRREGCADTTIHRVGDVMLDAVRRFTGDRPLPDVAVRVLAGDASGRDDADSAGTAPASPPYVLATIHRPENTDDRDRLAAIITGLRRVAADIPVILPLHPRTEAAAKRAGLDVQPGMTLTAERGTASSSDPPSAHHGGHGGHGNHGVHVLPPVGYLDMLQLERRARAIVTDSGGVQKEACFHGVPCVTVRDRTEWVELVETGANELVPDDVPTLARGITRAVRRALDRRVPVDPEPLYGDGRAAERVAALVAQLALGEPSTSSSAAGAP